MSRTRFFLAAASAATATLVHSYAARAQAVTWNPTQALAVGSGCSSAADMAYIAMGNDVAILFSHFGVALTDGSPGGRLAEIQSCTLRVPGILDRGYRITRVKQQHLFGVQKTAGSTARFTASSTLVGVALSAYTDAVGVPAANDPAMVSSQTEDVDISACAEDLTGLLMSSMSVSGNRESTSSTLIMGLQGLDHRFDFLLTTTACAG